MKLIVAVFLPGLKADYDFFDHVNSKDQNGLQALVFPNETILSRSYLQQMINIFF